MKHHVFSSLAIAGLLAGLAPAQSWAELVARQWPGDTIRKVSEKEFEAFVAQHAGALGKDGAYDAFLDAQHRAYGLPTGSPWPQSFAVPSDDRRLTPVERVLDGLVQEGPEPNGDPRSGGTPTPLSCADQGDGAIDVGGDQDWWQVTLPFQATFQVLTMPGLTGAGLPGAVSDTVVEVYDSSYNLVAFNDDYRIQYLSAIYRDTYSFCEVELPAGAYWVSVRAYSSSQTGTYSLDVRCTAPFQVIPEGPEPNESPATGGTPTLLPLGLQGDGEVTPAGDHDWWQIDALQTTSVILVTGPSLQNGGAIGDSTLELFDSAGQSLATDDDGGPQAYSLIEYVLMPGTYYADVAGYGTNTGTYRLFAYVVPTPANPVAEGPEPNGDPRQGGTPTPIGCDQAGTGEITGSGGSPPAGDEDWWSFNVSTGGWVTVFTLANPARPSGLGTVDDLELWIYDSQYVELAYDDDGGVSLYSEVGLWLEPGTYYARVEGYGAANVGDYFIFIECSGGLPGFASFSTGCARANGQIPGITTRDLELAIIGTTFVADYVNLPVNGSLFAMVGLSRTATTVGGFQLPLDLGLIGAPGCVLAADPLAAIPISSGQYGTASLALTVPLNPGLMGAVLFTQAVIPEPGTNPLGIVTSDMGAIIVGTRL